MQIEQISLDDLKVSVNNSRTHASDQVEQIAASMTEFGFTNPILIDEIRTIIAGHGRLAAARSLEMVTVPCVTLYGLTETQRRAYLIADNQLPLNADWDLDILKAEVDAVEKLCAGTKAQLIHADPPYGMGKQSDGVLNDNLYREKLDQFQMDWWNTFRLFTEDNTSVYIWGNAPDLWRLWYSGGLNDSEKFEFRNEIVWDKKSIPGMASDLMTQYPEASERCLYFQIGEQFIGNVNSDQYWEGWDEIRLYLESEAIATGLSPQKCREITGVQMFAHWFSKSQWSIISEMHYSALQEALPGHFLKPYKELRETYNEIKGGYRNHVNGILGGMRSYFDNAHDVMRDVWEFSRVLGDERHGHATPKPVDMMERVMKSSLPKGGLCLEPFGGSGSTLMGAERTGRRCYSMELQAVYVDVIVRRWQIHTGNKAIHAETGVTFDEIS